MVTERDELEEKILASARQEFLDCGYQEASLRRICRQAGLTTGALYKRFKGKDELFVSVLAPTLADLEAYAQEQKERDYEFLDEGSMAQMWEHRLEDIEAIMHIFYQHRENMQLLLFRSQGSSQADFKASLPRLATLETYRYLEQAYEAGQIPQLIDRAFLESAMFAYYTALIEPLAQDWPEDRALAYGREIIRLFDWGSFLGF